MPEQEEGLAGYPEGARIEWFGATSAKESDRWLPGVVTGTRVRGDDAIVFFRLDSEQRLRMPHELHWQYRDRIRQRR